MMYKIQSKNPSLYLLLFPCLFLLISCKTNDNSFYCTCNRKKENIYGKKEEVKYYQISFSDTIINDLKYSKYWLGSKLKKYDFIRHDSIEKKIYYLSALSFEYDSLPPLLEFAEKERVIFDYSNSKEREIRLISLLQDHFSKFDKRIDSCTLGFKMRHTPTAPISGRSLELIYLFFNVCSMKISYVKFTSENIMFECNW